MNNWQALLLQTSPAKAKSKSCYGLCPGFDWFVILPNSRRHVNKCWKILIRCLHSTLQQFFYFWRLTGPNGKYLIRNLSWWMWGYFSNIKPNTKYLHRKIASWLYIGFFYLFNFEPSRFCIKLYFNEIHSILLITIIHSNRGRDGLASLCH